MLKIATVIAVVFACVVPVALGQEKKAEPSKEDQQINLGARVDCFSDLNRNKGVTQPCFRLTGLRVALHQTMNEDVRAWLRLDPFAMPAQHLSRTARRGRLPSNSDSSFGIIEDFRFTWSPRTNLELRLEDFSGSASLPDGGAMLAEASPFDVTGWDQLALSVTYILPAFSETRVTFTAGNGEGEGVENLDPQQYFGVGIKAAFVPGLIGSIGISIDGNNIGSEFYDWQSREWQSRCNVDAPAVKSGYSTQRMAFAIELDGNLAAARGLRAALGYQQRTASDLDKDKQSLPTLDALSSGCDRLSLDDFFVETEVGGSANTVRQQVIGLNASYKILDTYFLAGDLQTRQTDSGSVEAFEECEAYVGTVCDRAGGEGNKISETSMTLGGGLMLGEGLDLIVEYNRTSYDKAYSLFYYSARDGKVSDTFESINARIAYNWD